VQRPELPQKKYPAELQQPCASLTHSKAASAACSAASAASARRMLVRTSLWMGSAEKMSAGVQCLTAGACGLLVVSSERDYRQAATNVQRCGYSEQQ